MTGAPRRWPSSAGRARPTRAPTPGPSWPRRCSAPTRWTPSSATACRPTWCSPCPGPPSTRPCAARVVVLLTGDLREELPVLFLRLRRAALDGGTALVELAPRPTSLTPYAAVSLPARPGDAPHLARALAGDDAARRPRRRTPRARPSTPRTWRRGQGPRRRLGRRRGGGARAALAGRARGRGGRGGGGTGRRAARRPLPAGPAPGQRRWAPSTWGWPPGSCPGGSRLDGGPGLVRGRLGLGAGGARARARPRRWPRWPARPRATTGGAPGP